jgi:hypothetical protein
MFVTKNFLIVPQVYSSAAAETVSLVSGSSPTLSGCKLIELFALNTNSSAEYLQLFDGYAAPSNGDVPLLVQSIGALGNEVLDFGSANCLPFQFGIVAALSSTAATYTAVSSHLFCTALFISS